MSTGTSMSVDVLTAWMTSSSTRTSSRSRCMTPASKREISSRSSTSCRNRSMSATIRSSAALARSGMSSRWFSSTSIDAARVMSGERSSWLTLEANRASRWIRSSRAMAISLNDVGQGGEVGVVAGLHPGLQVAGGDGVDGLADAPERAQRRAEPPTSRWRRRPASTGWPRASSEMLIDSRVSSSSWSETISK